MALTAHFRPQDSLSRASSLSRAFRLPQFMWILNKNIIFILLLFPQKLCESNDDNTNDELTNDRMPVMIIELLNNSIEKTKENKDDGNMVIEMLNNNNNSNNNGQTKGNRWR